VRVDLDGSLEERLRLREPALGSCDLRKAHERRDIAWLALAHALEHRTRLPPAIGQQQRRTQLQLRVGGRARAGACVDSCTNASASAAPTSLAFSALSSLISMIEDPSGRLTFDDDA